MGWEQLKTYACEGDDCEHWVLDYLDAAGTFMHQYVGFTRTATAEPFTRQRINEVKREHEARVLAEGGTIL